MGTVNRRAPDQRFFSRLRRSWFSLRRKSDPAAREKNTSGTQGTVYDIFFQIEAELSLKKIRGYLHVFGFH